MNDQIVFSLKELLVGIVYIVSITLAVIKLAHSVRKMKRNDLAAFLTKDEFQEFQKEYIRDITELKKDVRYLMDKVCKK